MVTVQLAVPEQPPPLQPAKEEPEDAAADSVAVVPIRKSAAQTVPQLIPEGEELTVPLPLPARVTVSVTGVPASVTCWNTALEVVAGLLPSPA